MKAKLVCVSFLLTLVTLSSLLTYASFEGAQSTAPLLPRVGSRDGLLTVSFLDVGQGDAILIRSPEGKLALIDSGPSRDIVENLWSQGIRALDLVVVTHHHSDHYGGMAEVIEAFQPRVFLASPSATTSTQYLELLELVRDRRIQAVVPAMAPRRIALGSVDLVVLPRAPEDGNEENNNSVAIRVQYGHFSVMLPGDAQEAERAWWKRSVPSLCADCTVLKLAHHGSRNGTDTAWLELVHPQLALASLGKGNDYGHPHPETTLLLGRRKVPLLRTDLSGSIVLQSDGRSWRIIPPSCRIQASRSASESSPLLRDAAPLSCWLSVPSRAR